MSSLFPEFAVRPTPRFLFVDMNSFYTSVEQQECEAYRDKPTIVVPVLADNTCAIAASYEAKALGVKTGTPVSLARSSSPQMQVVEARPQLYLDYHARLVNALRDLFVTIKVLSVDEMACRIPASCRTQAQEQELALAVKRHIGAQLGSHLRCSIGIGPNIFLAKVASERNKPDGLTVWDGSNLPDALFPLALTDLPGIGSATRRRLEAAGIGTVEALWEATPIDLRRAWGSVVGAKWYYMLRGSRELDYQPMQGGERRKSLGHSNVLAPEHRTLCAAQEILLELFAKALKRLRSYHLLAGSVQVTVKYRRMHTDTSGAHAPTHDGTPMGKQGACNGAYSARTDARSVQTSVYGASTSAYGAHRGAQSTLPFITQEGVWTRRSRKHLHASDELTWLKVVRPMLDALPDLSPHAEPAFVGIVFGDLLARQDVNLSLFDEPDTRQRLADIVDALNHKHGRATGIAILPGRGEQIPQRIPFGAPG